MQIDVPYGITRRLLRTTMKDARERVARALSAEGFGVLTEIDVQATLLAKIGAEVAPYTILGACNPKLAHRALSAEPGVGLLLPCNVVLAADADDVILSAASPSAMFAIARTTGALEEIAAEAEQRIRRVVENA